jgi:amino acid adenylation domain-containing protein
MAATGAQAMHMTNAASMISAAAESHAGRAAIIEASSGESTSYAQLWQHARAIAHSVREAGLRPGDRAAIFVERGRASAAAYFGVLAAGGVAVIMHESLKSRQLDYIIRHAGAKLILSAGIHLARAAPVAPPGVKLVDLGGLGGGALELPSNLAAAEIVERTGADMAHIIYTSGSTGMPKGVVVSHANVWAGMHAVVEYLDIRARDRLASLLPLSFDYGLSQLLCAVGTGATLIVERTPLAQRIVESIYDQRVTVLAAVPPLWLQLLNVERFRNEPLESLRVMTNTGGRLPTTAVRALRRSHPEAHLVLMYGLTEAFRSTYLPPERVDDKPDSMGRAIPGAEVLVVRDDLSPCEVGEVGQLVHRGPTVTMGYWNDPEATRERFGPHPLRPAGTPDAERVVFSGDLVRMDEDGDLYFVGRRDAMIKSMGHRVAPDEVTEPLYASGEIVEAVITTEPDELRGDAIIAHVVLREGGSLERLERYAARELPRYMQPQRYELHAELARTTSGKHDGRAVSEAPR